MTVWPQKKAPTITQVIHSARRCTVPFSRALSCKECFSWQSLSKRVKELPKYSLPSFFNKIGHQFLVTSATLLDQVCKIMFAPPALVAPPPVMRLQDMFTYLDGFKPCALSLKVMYAAYLRTSWNFIPSGDCSKVRGPSLDKRIEKEIPKAKRSDALVTSSFLLLLVRHLLLLAWHLLLLRVPNRTRSRSKFRKPVPEQAREQLPTSSGALCRYDEMRCPLFLVASCC